MTAEDRLALLKLDLIISSAAYDKLLNHYLAGAKMLIEREGITLDLSAEEDNTLVIGYAAFLFRKRNNPTEEFPRWLRWSLNNRLFGGGPSG